MFADSSAQQLHGGYAGIFTREDQSCLGVREGWGVCVWVRHAGRLGGLWEIGLSCWQQWPFRGCWGQFCGGRLGTRCRRGQLFWSQEARPPHLPGLSPGHLCFLLMLWLPHQIGVVCSLTHLAALPGQASLSRASVSEAPAWVSL